MQGFKVYKVVIAGAILLVIAGAVCAGVVLGLGWLYVNYLNGDQFQAYDGGDCNVAVIPLEGQIWASQADANAADTLQGNANTSGEAIVAAIERAKSDYGIKGILLQVDSPGGSPVGGQMVSNALKNAKKPSAAVILDEGDSAAYLASTGANEIIASRYSDVADIGVTGSYVDQSGSNKQNGSTFEQIAAGQYKDVGNPDAPLTAEGKAYLQSLVDDEYQSFISDVSKNRSIALDAVKKLANGNSLTGQMAMGTGLIDKLGDNTTAVEWFNGKLGKGTQPVLCAPSVLTQPIN